MDRRFEQHYPNGLGKPPEVHKPVRPEPRLGLNRSELATWISRRQMRRISNPGTGR
jgi:hypothetical protein